MADELTREDRLWAIEQAVSHIEGRYVERQIQAATSRAEAVAAASAACSWWGQSGRDGSVSGLHDRARGIFVRRRGREGLVGWGELVDVVLAQGQESLF